MLLLKAIFLFIRGILTERSIIAVENLVLHQQLAVFRQSMKRPKVRNLDRIFWVWISRLWNDWHSYLIVVKPDTVIRWHREGFRLFWRRKLKRRKTGQPKLDSEIRARIRRMSKENLWGAPRIQDELRLLGYDVAKSTVEKYMIHNAKPPSQTRRTFLDNHAHQIAAIDFFTPTGSQKT